VAADTQQVDTVEKAIAAAKRVLIAPGKILDPSIWPATKDTANQLMILANRRLDKLAYALRGELEAIRPELQFQMGTSYDLSPALLPYKANRLEYQQTYGLMILNSPRRSNIEVQAHGIGTKYRGLIGIVTVFDDGSRNPVVVSTEPFQVNYAESYESAERRFRPWLEESLVNALTLWRKSL